MFLVNDKLDWRDKKSSTSPGTMVHAMHVHFMFFVVLKKLKSSFSEDNVLEHVLDIHIENATKMVWINPLKAKNGDQTLR